MHKSFLKLAVMTVAAGAAHLSGATITYSDSDLRLADYTVTQNATAGASISVTNDATSLRMDVSVPTGTGAGMALINSAFTYDPSMGALSGIDSSLVVASSRLFRFYHLYLQQGGTLYRALVSAGAEGGAAPLAATGLTASAFNRVVDVSQSAVLGDNPNFALPFLLGVGATQVVPQAGFDSSTRSLVMRDLAITLTVADPPASGVPEPSTWAMAGAGLLALAWRRRG